MRTIPGMRATERAIGALFHGTSSAYSFGEVPRRCPMPVERSAMLGAQLWVVRWAPRDGVTAADIEAALDDHLEWMLGLEAVGHVVASGPLTSGPGVTPGAGLTVLRASTEEEAAALAAQD